MDLSLLVACWIAITAVMLFDRKNHGGVIENHYQPTESFPKDD